MFLNRAVLASISIKFRWTTMVIINDILPKIN